MNSANLPHTELDAAGLEFSRTSHQVAIDRFRREATLRLRHSRSRWAPFFRSLASFRKLRSIAIRTICKIEGGQMWSVTYRELMSQYYLVQVGIHSYGPCLNPGCLPEGTSVGNYCSLAPGIQVVRRNHPTDRITQHPFFYNSLCGLIEKDSIHAVRQNPLTIGHDVWIGQDVVIAPGCRVIGDSSVVAAGAVIAKDVPPFAIVGGIPGRFLRWRLPDALQTQWIKSQWWLKPIDEHSDALDSFLRPLAPEATELRVAE